MMQLSLRLLGPLQISVDGQLIPESRSKKIEALLVYLVMELQRAHRRENLVGLLFPDMPDEAARTNLRQTFTRLRRAIQDHEADPPFLLAARESTQFNRESQHDLDVAQFEAALCGCELHQGQRNGRCPDCMACLAAGTALYRGPFLDGFFLEDSTVFDEWMLAQRENWQRAALAALQQLADYHERRGEYADASRYVQRRLEIEPWDEAALRQLLRLLAYQGQRAAALVRFQAFADMLAEELGVKPEAETLALRQQIAAAKETRPAHLPPREQMFIGRAEELGQIRQQLADPENRLVTLVGPGGIGKTRLAIETGWRVADDNLGPFWHGVTFVSLAGVMAAETSGVFNPLITAVAESLGFTFAGASDPQTQLLKYLGDKSLLLIMDNFEHLTLTGRDLLLALIQQARNLKILVTSRERLHLSGEWVLEIDGLPVPPSISAADVEDYGAVALFVQRARQKDARFVMSRNGESDGQHACRQTAVVKICRLLHGIPLAIELATTWVRLLPCDDIVQEIERNLDALTSQLHDSPERHRSLRAVFEHSWRLLTPDEQQAVRRLAYFRGGFSREAALTVAEASLPQLAALLNKSLLQRLDVTPDDGPGTAVSPTHTRYQMLEVLRQYAYEKLAANPAEADAVRKNHARYYLAFLQQRAAALRGHGQQAALGEIRLEMENIRLAWQQALAQGDWPAINQAVDTLSLFYYMRSWFAEGSELFTQAANRLEGQARASDTAVLQGKLLARQGWFTFLLGHADQAYSLLEQSREWLRPFTDAPDLVYTLVFLAVVTYNRGDLETAVQLAQDGLIISQSIGNRYYEAIANNILSQIAYLRGDFAAARSYCETSLAIEREIGNRWSMGFSLANLGRVAYALGNFAEAQERYRESLAIREALRDGRGQAICHNYLGDTTQALGDLAAAANYYQASLAFSRDISSQSGMIFSLNRLGHLWLAQGKIRPAQSCFDEALRLAYETQVVPQLLESMTGVAALLAGSQPGKALALAQKVAEHPAAVPESQAQAAALQERLKGTAIDEGWLARPLTDLVKELL